MEEYIKRLLEQVRFRKAHKAIEDEIRVHMEDQIDANMAEGMDRDVAEKRAVEDMGDPVEVGVAMDSVHRPQMAWGVVIIAVVIGIASILVHELIVKDAAQGQDLALHALGSYIFYLKVLMGLGAMVLVYLLDYTRIAKYAKVIAVVMFVMLTAGVFTIRLNGAITYLRFAGVNVLASAMVMLYVPLYGAILYKYRGGGAFAFIKALCWMVVPVMIVVSWPQLMVAVVLVLTMTVQLTIAVAKGWYKIPVKRTIAGLWACVTVLPVTALLLAYKGGLLADYQIKRIRGILYMDYDASYVTRLVRSYSDVNLVGGSGQEVLGNLPNCNSEFLLTYLANKLGLVAVISLVASVFAVIIMGCLFTVRSKNQLGLVMGVGCMNVLLVNGLVNMCENMGILPYTSSFMPFFSAGASNIVLAYIFLGVILSIYKYRDAYPQHVDVKIRGRIKIGNAEIVKN
ncbi:FtsW/RodA/SpoVE family cell cycle protein [Butyrivibrio proteoclasticus]|uniref:FtsW/RodA/SpoVE family cell cycle protein n=1 Tax=Butyrivibrio proteoclasticus TaxID=43305 RepID=UPI000688DF2F|nr:FtsW/RodA/SpoVE family cell cycle protein [Butyrivibrio proteoclasticus]